jgi:uncharacterized protein (TIGR02266 family)
MVDERRSSHRVRISGVRVTYETASGSVEADALDLGPGGLFVRTAAPLAVGKRLSLEIQVIGEQGPWMAMGRVVWTRVKGEGDHAPPGMGVKIIDADDGVIAAIEHLVETREKTEPGVGPGSNPPPPPSRQREPTLSGVGPAPTSSPPPAPPPERERSIAIDLATRKAPPAPPPSPIAPTRPPGGGRWIVVLLLVIVAAIAAYVLIDGFLRPPH